MPKRSTSSGYEPPEAGLTGDDIAALIAEILTGATGQDGWREMVGTVTVTPITTSPLSNWKLTPAGSAEEVAAVEMAAEIVRGQHPYARA